jgi:hypothetical protein
MKLFEIEQTSPEWLLCESTKNTHLEHLEDLVFNEGYTGAQRALNYLENLRRMFADGAGDRTKITVKWDGAPAIICGTDPADGKFFVGTKSAFNKTNPKVCKSLSDIQAHYGENPGLVAKLSDALKYLRALGVVGVMQGDLMFTHDDITVENINGEDVYVFTPNTITYAVPVNSNLGRRIASAKLGIIFHTAYEGDSLATMSAAFGASVAGLNASKNVWYDDATYKDFTGIASLTPEENTAIENTLIGAATTLKKFKPATFNRVLSNDEFNKYIKPFINSMVRSGTQVGEPTEFLKSFIAFYKGKQEEAIFALKGGPDSKAALARYNKIKETEEFIADNSNTLLGILAIYKRVIEGKMMMIEKMQRIESIGTFIKTNDGYKVTAPEGFVAVGHDGGAVKLVDRLEFSKHNFTAVKSWTKAQ